MPYKPQNPTDPFLKKMTKKERTAYYLLQNQQNKKRQKEKGQKQICLVLDAQTVNDIEARRGSLTVTKFINLVIQATDHRYL